MDVIRERFSIMLGACKVFYSRARYVSFSSLFDCCLAMVITGALISSPILSRAQSSGSPLQRMIVTGQASPSAYSGYGVPEAFSRSRFGVTQAYARANPTTRATSASCTIRARVAASDLLSSSGDWTSSQASCEGSWGRCFRRINGGDLGMSRAIGAPSFWPLGGAAKCEA